MDRKEVFDKLNMVFREVFDDEEIEVLDVTTAEDIEDWDSFEHVNLIMAIEQAFHIKFGLDEVIDMKNVGDMVNAILERVN